MFSCKTIFNIKKHNPVSDQTTNKSGPNSQIQIQCIWNTAENIRHSVIRGRAKSAISVNQALQGEKDNLKNILTGGLEKCKSFYGSLNLMMTHFSRDNIPFY